ncbi:flagellin [Xylanivirga thermophila]|uniref:flagellin n=1 Tax=Xylanivirga thermophila TaxID=2496273 RepID=UPI0039F52778
MFEVPDSSNNIEGEDIVWSTGKLVVATMAKEMMEFTKNNILQQAATAMLAQANQAPQSVLQLLR